MPEYFEDFECKCGRCRSVCCHGWTISLNEREYMRLLGLKCSSELRSKLDNAFQVAPEPTEERYALAAKRDDGCCRLLREDGLCMLQRECGEGVLPSVCRLYPRSVRMGRYGEICCSGSCENTVELIMRYDRVMKIILKEYDAFPQSTPPAEASEKSEMRERCIRAMERDGSAEERLKQLGAVLGAKKRGLYTTNSDYLSGCIRLLSVFRRVSPNLREYGDCAISYLCEADMDDDSEPELTVEAAERFERAYLDLKSALPNVELYYTNLLINHMMYEQFPYNVQNNSLDDAYVAINAAAALLRFITVCCCASCDNTEERFADSAAATLRYIEHTDFYKNAVIVMRSIGG